LLLGALLLLALVGVAVPWNVSLPVGAFALGGLYLAFGKADRLRIKPIDTNKPPAP
jgi:hypothetical protein